MTPERAHDAAWADFELMAASDGLRAALERAIRALNSVARAGTPFEIERQAAITLLGNAEERVRSIRHNGRDFGAQVWGDAMPRGIA